MDRVWQYKEVVKVTWISFLRYSVLYVFFFFTFLLTKNTKMKKKSVIKDWKKEQTKRYFSRTWIQSARSALFFSRLAFNGAASCNLYIWEGDSPSLVRSPENQRAGLLNELCMSLPCYELFRFTILAVYKALEKYLAKKQSTEFIKNNKIPFQVMFLLPDEREVSWHLIFFTVWEFVSHPPNFLSDDRPPISTQRVPVCLTWQSILLMSQLFFSLTKNAVVICM